MTHPLLREIRRSPLLWLLAFVPAVFAGESLAPEAHTLLFVLSVLAIVPLAALLSHATESVAAKTGDAAGGLLNATLGNLTELVIALAALRAGEYMLVKASIAGAIVTNTLFMLGASFLLGGLKHHVQEFNQASARLQSGLLFLATVALLIPSTLLRRADPGGRRFLRELSVGLSVLLIAAYGLGLVFSLRTHQEFFGSAEHEAEAEERRGPSASPSRRSRASPCWSRSSARCSWSRSSRRPTPFGMTPAFVGFIVVALVGARCGDGVRVLRGAQEPAGPERRHRARQRRRKSRSSSRRCWCCSATSLGPTPMDLQFWPGAVVMMLIATLTASLVTNGGRSAWFVGVLS